MPTLTAAELLLAAAEAYRIGSALAAVDLLFIAAHKLGANHVVFGEAMRALTPARQGCHSFEAWKVLTDARRELIGRQAA